MKNALKRKERKKIRKKEREKSRIVQVKFGQNGIHIDSRSCVILVGSGYCQRSNTMRLKNHQVPGASKERALFVVMIRPLYFFFFFFFSPFGIPLSQFSSMEYIRAEALPTWVVSSYANTLNINCTCVCVCIVRLKNEILFFLIIVVVSVTIIAGNGIELRIMIIEL